MTSPNYDWKRYWVLRDGGFAFDSDGFLLPPSKASNRFAWCHKDVKDYNDLLTHPCLVLLGEPGIGKSFAIREAEKRTRAASQNSQSSFLFRDLSSYNSDSLLVTDVFESPEFLRWQAEGHELHLFLDSFDECLLRVDSVAALLAERFSRLTRVNNLFLRIASRTADWQIPLEDGLRQKWGNDSVSVYELAPLTRDQVLQAAGTHLTDPARFISEVISSEVVSFATRPLTLNFLIQVWGRRGGSLPPTIREVYEQGCVELCTDCEKRQTPKLRSGLSPQQLVTVASHIAAATFFCNRTAIWTGTSGCAKPDSDVSLSELACGAVSSPGGSIEINEAVLRKTLNTGLFTSRGRGRVGWAHQTFGEFLAARYLIQERLDRRQILDLLIHPADPQERLIPQLREIAAWVANHNREIFKYFSNTEPTVLLQSDISSADVLAKVVLVDALLFAIAGNCVQSDWWAMRRRYGKLNHPRLAQQLGKYLFCPTAIVKARVEAALMVEACDLRRLLPGLAKLALDPREAQEVREYAAAVVSRSDSVSAKRLLLPLACGKAGGDPKDELRGAGLMACWPAHISAQSLFESLKAPKEGFHGLYDIFLSCELTQKLPVRDLPVALAWVQAQPKCTGFHTSYGTLIWGILKKASEQLEQDNLLVPFAGALLARLRKRDYYHWHHNTSFLDPLRLRRDLRHKLVMALASMFEDASGDALLITRLGFRLVFPDDVSWLLEQLRSEEQTQVQLAYAHLVGWSFSVDDACQVDAIIQVAQENGVLQETLACWLKPMRLDSEVALKAREAFTDLRSAEHSAKKHGRRSRLNPSPAERAIALLDQFEKGEFDGWWQLCLCLELEESGEHGSNWYSVDLRKLPGWKVLDNTVRLRLVDAAERYVIGRSPQPEEWFSRKNIKYHPAVAGIRAILLLGNEAPTRFQGLPLDVWQRWIPALLRQVHYGGETEDYRLLTKNAFSRAPAECAKWTSKVLTQENEEGENLWVLDKLPDQWPSELAEALLKWAKRGAAKPQCLVQLLRTLGRHHQNKAIQLFRSLTRGEPPQSPSERLVFLCAARLVMLHGEPKDWPPIWHRIKNSATFGRELLEGFAYEYHHDPSPPLKTLPESDIGLLWEWLEAQYPPTEDRDRTSGGEVTIRDAMADFRGHVVNHLANIGTPAGCTELKRLAKKYPQYPWLFSLLSVGQELMRRNTWLPPTVSHLYSLRKDAHCRLVQSPSQLLEVIVSSLTALQDKLRGERQMAQFLWDGDRPKTEEALSDYLAGHLDEDLVNRGIIVGREVQIRRFNKVDLCVVALSPKKILGYEKLSVVIEVKGCWHPEVKSAMQTQLLDRYLRRNACGHGLYLVAWFPRNSWDSRDSRRRKVPFKTRSQLAQHLACQAKSLPSETMVKEFVLDCSLPRPARRT